MAEAEIDHPATRMMASLPGVLLRAAERLKHTRDMKHLEFMLQQLHSHLVWLRSHKDGPDAVKALNDFFEVWVQ